MHKKLVSDGPDVFISRHDFYLGGFLESGFIYVSKT